MSRPGARERGLSESLSWALIAPALLLVVLGIIEVAIWAHGRDVAGSAAAAGADVGSVRGGT
ncbi:MAG: TadE/TadG family type IV pilus assembly protein, partial [Propionibacteriaceae bacterium]